MFRMAASYGALALLGCTVGVVGTAGHRYQPYWGSGLVLFLVLSAGTFSRAWRSWSGLAVFAISWFVAAYFLYAVEGPGGSVVILGDTLGKVWLFGGAIAATAPAFLPRRWFAGDSRVAR